MVYLKNDNVYKYMKKKIPYHLSGNLVYVFMMDNLEDQNKIRFGNGADEMVCL
jgi:hypothetical protein